MKRASQASRFGKIIVVLAVLAFVRGERLHAQTENNWIGRRVITQFGTVLRVGNQVVDDAGRGKQLARRKNRQAFLVYKVEQVDGPWLWLAAEGSGVRGWAPAANVILFDQAIEYISSQILANPGDADNYLWRRTYGSSAGSSTSPSPTSPRLYDSIRTEPRRSTVWLG